MYKFGQGMFAEWKAKLLAYLTGSVLNNEDQRIAWAGEQGQPIAEHRLGVAFGEQAEHVKVFSLSLRAKLLSTTTDHPFQVVHSWPEGDGLAAMRAVMRSYEARKLGTTTVGL